MSKKTFFFLWVLLLSGTKPDGQVLARPTLTQYDLEAAYLLRFMDFVEWPAAAFKGGKAPFVIGILGNDPFEGALDGLVQGRSYQGRAIRVQRFGDYDPNDLVALQDCEILFVADSERGRVAQILRQLGRSPVLTVSEIDKFPLYGGVIRFDLDGKKVRLSLNPKAAKKAKLRVGARLLQVCRILSPE